MFENKVKEVEPEIAMILARVSHHVHPLIVEKIVEANKNFKERFSAFCHESLTSDDYFYDGSDCIFPGVRRSINAEKGTKEPWKNNIYSLDGTILNDNTYPRHLWAYLFNGKGYSGGKRGSWSASNLNSFELAHIFAHKTDERILECKVFEGNDDRIKPYALFTSASNIVLIPKGLTKPTDKLDSIKKAFYKRHLDLYANSVKLPGLGNFDTECIPEWYNELKWIDPILPDNWENNINKLLKYREKHLLEKYKSTQII